ncbi:redox-regulated ATPase YchF [Thermoproteota archaeon]
MTLSIGIVGLPNVGKSSLFNAITNAQADAQNYPFCTIDPNVGIVTVPDSRIDAAAELSKSQKTIYATVEFIDIAGLVKGASDGEGLGNQFLGHIRQASAIAHVVRCFKDDNVVHVSGSVDPIRDVEIINLELILADLQMVERLIESQEKRAKTHDKEELKRLEVLSKLRNALSKDVPVRLIELSNDEEQAIKLYDFLTLKPIIYVANISEDMIGQDNPEILKLADYAKQTGARCIRICTKLESELIQLENHEKSDMLNAYGLKMSGLDKLAHACYELLGLQTFITTGPKETRAWTIQKGTTAPKAAGVIHTDFEKGFIRATVISYNKFMECSGWKTARELGLIRQEGKEYVMQEGDIVEFLFNV